MSWASVRDAFQSAIVAASGLASTGVVWAFQDTDQPAMDYASLSLGSALGKGLDWVRESTDLTRPRGSEVALQVVGQREATLTVEVYSAHTVAAVAEDDALAIAERVRSALILPSIRATLRAANIAPIDTGPAQYIPTIVGASFRGRAVLAIRCYVPAQAVVEYVGYIASFSGTGTIKGGVGGDKTVPIVVP